MNIIIRTDLGSHYGLGHATRMLALARVLASQGATVAFVTATEALREYVKPFRCYVFPEEAPCNPGDVLVIDTKAQDWANDLPKGALWLARDSGLKVVRIDHPAAAPDSCDLLIAPGNHWSPETVTRLRSGFSDRFLYGWDYVLLDPEVTNLVPIPYPERVRGPVVFCAGGSDPSGALQQMYDWTKDLETEQELVFMEGAHRQGNLDPRDIMSRASACTLTDFDRRWIRQASLLVTMFGTTCYESLYWQTPQLILSHTEETQEAVWLAYITESAAHPSDPRHAQDFCNDLTFHINTPGLLERMSENAVRYVPLDGDGIHRVAAAILQLKE